MLQAPIIITPSFSSQEYDALMDLIDLGVKTGGLKVATNAAVLAQKLTGALQAAQATAQVQTAQAAAPQQGPQEPASASAPKQNGAKPAAKAGNAPAQP